MNWKTLLASSLAVLAVLLLGALGFYLLEREEAETPVDIRTLDVFKNFLADNPGISESNLTAFVNDVILAYDNGAVVGNTSEMSTVWDYDDAIFFSVTVLTTIGYGNITPKTSGGKLLCIFYALIGIPVMVVFLTNVGQYLRKPMNKVHNLPKCVRDEGYDKIIKSNIPDFGCPQSGVVLSLGALIMIVVPGIIFKYTEDWDFLTSMYYATITLTTIGFGDYVAGTKSKRNAVYRIFTSIWMIMGLSFLSLIVAEVSERYSRRIIKRTEGKDDPKGDEIKMIDSVKDKEVGAA